MRKLLIAALACAAILCFSGCEPPEKEDSATTTSGTTTSKVGGFVVREEAPGGDIQWEEIGNAE